MKPLASTVVVLLIAIAMGASEGCSERRPPAATPPAAGPVELPAGTVLALRMAQAIDSASAAPGQAYAAVVSRDVNDAAEQTQLPSGSPATLILMGGPPYELRLAAITLNGDAFMVENPETNASQSGVALGVFLGAVPGTEQNPPPTGPISVTGERVRVPVDTLLTFRLNSRIRLIGSH